MPSHPIRAALLTVPVEPDYSGLIQVSNEGTSETAFTNRSSGELPVLPKIAIISLIKWMERHGYGPETYDFYDVDMLLPSDQELTAYFKSYNPTVIGISGVVATTYIQVKRIARLAREACPDAWIVLGGHLTAAANTILHKTAVDVCVCGDGEIAWVEFLNYVKEHGRATDFDALAKIQGLAYLGRKNELQFTGFGRTIPAEDNPLPDYELLKLGLKHRPQDLANYFRKGRDSLDFQTDPRTFEPHRRPNFAGLWSSKGCVARCTFCQRTFKGYRTQSLPKLEEHLEMLRDKYNVGFIFVLDENFASDREYAYAFAETLHRYDMLWNVGGIRVSSVEYEDIKFFRDHGCSRLKFGVETGSQKIMDIMEKKFTVERVYKTLKHCSDLDIYSPMAVMVGMPGETNETVMDTGKLVGRIAYEQGLEPKNKIFQVFYALPLPGTPLYVYAQKVGVIGTSPDEEEKYLQSTAGSGTEKPNYRNLTGSSLRDVLFWDFLVMLEAERTFFELCRKKPLQPPDHLQKIVTDYCEKFLDKDSLAALTWSQIWKSLRDHSLSGIKGKLFYAIDIFTIKRIVPSRLAARLPRWLVYGFVKNLIYFEFLIQKVAMNLYGRTANIYGKQPEIRSLNDSHDHNLRKSRSLRTVVMSPTAPGKNQAQLNQEVLAIGF